MGHNDSSPFAPNIEFLNRFSGLVEPISRFYNDYQVEGLENLPAQGGALLVLYHGLVPLDFWYLGLHIYRRTGRPPCALVDRFLLKTPGLAWLTRNVGGVVGERATALRLLQNGVVVGVSPGGVREAISGQHNNYRLVWGGRKGFAELAIKARVPIIPGFTENVEELYRSPGAGSPLLQKIYELTRLPIVPIVGLGLLPFPVALKTRLGQPILPLADETADSVAQRTQSAIEALIQQHQSPNPTILRALKQRFFK